MTLRQLTSWSLLATTLLLGAIGCSDAEDGPAGSSAGTAGIGGSGGGSGSAGVGGSAGTGGSTNVYGPAGAGGSAGSGTAGAAGAGGVAGTVGTAGAGGGDAGVGDSGAVVPSKLVALTFDDGPDATLTAAVLDKLEAHQVPASFFLIGQNIGNDDQAVLQRAAALGCTFENHSNNFDSLTGLTVQEVADRVNGVSDAIEQATGVRPAFFRAPNLATDANMFTAIDLPFSQGIVGGDFPGANPTTEAVTNAVLTQVQDGSIILLHDVQPSLNPQPTPPALDIIIPELQSQGYEFVTVRELFARRGVDPNSQQDVPWSVVPPND